MLPLPPFAWLAPTTVDEVVRALAAGPPGAARLCAGGTDLLPSMKRGLVAPRTLVSLARVRELDQVTVPADGSLTVGAGVTLERLAADERVARRWPALADAAGRAASPQIRRMATLGGNLCLDTRCAYYDQSAFWRGALGGCLKTGGDTCHVVPAGQRCVAALVADTPAPLIAAGAEVELVSPRGPRRLPLAGFYRGDGVANNVLAPDELLARVHLPPPPPGTRSAYQRLQRRDAIDFPLLSVAATAEVATDGGGTLRALRVVVTALGALPRALKGLDALVAAGRRVDDGALHAEVGALAARQCHPLENVGSAQWRQDVVGAVVRRALAALG